MNIKVMNLIKKFFDAEPKPTPPDWGDVRAFNDPRRQSVFFDRRSELIGSMMYDIMLALVWNDGYQVWRARFFEPGSRRYDFITVEADFDEFDCYEEFLEYAKTNLHNGTRLR